MGDFGGSGVYVCVYIGITICMRVLFQKDDMVSFFLFWGGGGKDIGMEENRATRRDGISNVGRQSQLVDENHQVRRRDLDLTG